MNAIAAIILIALLADLFIHLLADILNLRMLRNELPAEFEGIYDPQRYRQSQAYLKINTRFGWFSSFFNLALILFFWFGKGFALLDGWVRTLGNGPIVTGLIYIAVLLLVKLTLSLPFNIYDTFVIEERFGFNRTTKRTFIFDFFKSLFLALLIGGPLLAAVLAFFQYAGHFAWVYCWMAVTLFMLIVQYVAPTWIMPLFNKFDPLPEGPLRTAIFEYAHSIQFPLQNIYVMDGSRRSRKSNAFFSGFGRHKRIVLFDTLIKQHTLSELVSVLAHEMGHYKKKHILMLLVTSILQVGLMFFLLSFFISYRPLFDAFFMPHSSVYAGLLFFGMLYAPIAFFVSLIIQIISRNNEYAADRFAVTTTREGRSLVDALKKLSVDNLSNLLPHPLYVFLNYSHPPVLQRVKAIKEIKTSEPPNL